MLTQIRGIGVSYLRLSAKEDGQDSAEEPGKVGRGAIEALVDPGTLNVLLPGVVVHGYWILTRV
jgi:hypothetical protein